MFFRSIRTNFPGHMGTGMRTTLREDRHNCWSSSKENIFESGNFLKDDRTQDHWSQGSVLHD